MPTWDQAGFRARNNDGSETTATWIAAENAPWAQALDAAFRVRFVIVNSGTQDNSPTPLMQLQYRKNGGTWTNVTGATTNVRTATGSGVSNSTRTTRQLSSGSGSLMAGGGEIDCNPGGNSRTGGFSQNFPTDTLTEDEYVITLRSADLTTDDLIELRVVADLAEFTAYTAIPQINGVPPAITGTGASTVADPTSAATGAAVFSGTGASTSVAPTSSANGAQVFAGTGASTIAGPTSAAAGDLGFSGTAASSSIAPTSAATGTEVFTGTGTSSVAAPTSEATGTHPHTGQAASTIAGPTSAAAGAETFSATGASSTPAPTSDAGGVWGFVGEAASAVPAPTSTASGAETFTATGASTAPAPTSAAEGIAPQAITGEGASTAAAPTSAADGFLPGVVTGAAASSVIAPTSAATGAWDAGVGNSTVVAPTSSAIGSWDAGIGASAVIAPTSTAAGAIAFQGEIVASVPSPTSAMQGSVPVIDAGTAVVTRSVAIYGETTRQAASRSVTRQASGLTQVIREAGSHD